MLRNWGLYRVTCLYTPTKNFNFDVNDMLKYFLFTVTFHMFMKVGTFEDIFGSFNTGLLQVVYV